MLLSAFNRLEYLLPSDHTLKLIDELFNELLFIQFDLQAFISEAENLLNPALSKLDFSEGVS